MRRLFYIRLVYLRLIAFLSCLSCAGDRIKRAMRMLAVDHAYVLQNLY